MAPKMYRVPEQFGKKLDVLYFRVRDLFESKDVQLALERIAQLSADELDRKLSVQEDIELEELNEKYNFWISDPIFNIVSKLWRLSYAEMEGNRLKEFDDIYRFPFWGKQFDRLYFGVRNHFKPKRIDEAKRELAELNLKDIFAQNSENNKARREQLLKEIGFWLPGKDPVYNAISCLWKYSRKEREEKLRKEIID